MTLSDRVKPMPAAAQGQGQGQQAAKPKLDATHVLETELPIGPIRTEQEQILADLIASTPDSEAEEKADYYFRLASLYSQQLRFWTGKAVELQKAADAGNDAAVNIAKKRQEAARASNEAKMNLLKAVKAYKGLTDNDAFRNYPKLDMALFMYGYTLQLGKYMKEARAVYDKLLKNFPTSTYVPTAHLVFGDYYFENGQLADAEARYKMVLKFPKSSVYWYAFYKQGWVHMNLSRYQEALETFFQIVAANRNDAKAKRLHDAARGDFVLAYAQVGKPDKAYDVFARIDKSAAGDLVLALADAARERGEADKALASYKQLVARAPTDGRACLWQYRVAHASISAASPTNEDKLKEIEALVAQYTRLQKVASAEGTHVDAECRDNAAAMAGELAGAYHFEWSKTQNALTLGYAERLYAAYVTAFPTEPARTMALGDVRWSLALVETQPKLRAERWAATALAFSAVPTFEGQRAATLAWLNKLDFAAPAAGPFKIARAPSRAPKPLPLKGHDQATMATFAAFIEHAATNAHDDNEVVNARLALATLLRTYKRFDEATDVLDKLLADHPTHASAEYAANLLLDSLVQAKSEDLPIVVAGMLADRTFVDTKPHLLKNLMALRPRR